MTKLILDISTYQKEVDYATVAQHVDGVILRCGFTGYGANVPTQDSMFQKHYDGFKAYGVPIGAYYFTIASTQKIADKEYAFIHDLLQHYTLDLGIWLDIEAQNNSMAWKSLSKTDRTTYALSTLDKLKADGYYTGFYANLDWLTHYIEVDRLSEHALWIANYGVSKPAYTAREYDMHQYTSNGTIDGISGKVDLSRQYKEPEVSETADKDAQITHYKAVIAQIKALLEEV